MPDTTAKRCAADAATTTVELGFRSLVAADIASLHAHAIARPKYPLLIDIAGPETCLSLAELKEELSDYGRTWVWHRGQEVVGFLRLFDIQEGLALANLDLRVFEDQAPPHALLSQGLITAARKAKVTRLQTLVFVEDLTHLARLEALGFEREGVLKQHFFHDGCYRDLAVLGRVWPERDANG